MKCNIEPLGDRILVKPHKEDDVLSSIQSATGETIEIMASGAHEEKPTSGIVLRTPLDYEGPIKPGDDIYFGRHSGYPVQADREGFLLIRAVDIIARVENQKGPLSKARRNMEAVQ